MQRILLAIAIFSMEGLSAYHPKNHFYGAGNFAIRGEDNSAVGMFNLFDGDSNSVVGHENIIDGDSNSVVGN